MTEVHESDRVREKERARDREQEGMIGSKRERQGAQEGERTK